MFYGISIMQLPSPASEPSSRLSRYVTKSFKKDIIKISENTLFTYRGLKKEELEGVVVFT